MNRKAIILASAFFSLCGSVLCATDQTVTIESAQTTDYHKKENGGELITFTGNVSITVTKGDDVSKIRADSIIYDKERDTLEAQGNVEYEHTTGKSGSEKFSGEYLTYDLEKGEGVFLGGRVVQDSGSTTKDPFVITAEITGKDSSTTMAFKNGVLTTCENDDPHWSIQASRIWLLPGNEIAVLNGVFHVGSFPIFYIPFFYYPSDEMIFHPVFGFRNREGYFVQTTTYLYGRKPLAVKTDASSGNSFADFLQSDTLKEQERQGFFLKNLQSDEKDAGSDYFKLIVDSYSSLGTMAGFDGSFTSSSYVKSVKLSGYAGFSKTLYPRSSSLFYSTYNTVGDETANPGWLFNNKLPFRFETAFTLKADKKPFQFSLSLPLISDPYFKQDFLDRSEDLNWFTLLTDADSLAQGNDISAESSFYWNASGAFTPEMTATSPYLSTASITSLSGNVTFSSKTNKKWSSDALESVYSPGRKFFYPEIIKPELKLSFGGTLYSSDSDAKRATAKAPDVSGIYNPFSPVTDAGQEKKETDTASAPEADRFIPSAKLTSDTEVLFPSSVFSIIWTLDPSIVQEIRYDASDWNYPSDIEWNHYASLYYQLKTGAKIQGSWTYDKNRFALTSALDFSGTKQDHPWLSSSVYDTSAEISTVKLSDYESSVYSIETTDTVKYVPFNRDDMFKPVSLGWDFTGTLFETEFDGTADDPSWKNNTFEWERKSVTEHTATAVAGVSLSDNIQSVTFVSNLPPMLGSYAGTANFGWTFVAATVATKLYQKETDKKNWFWDPLKATVTWKLPFSFTLGQEYQYSIEDKEPTRLNLTVGRSPFSAYYTINNTVPYKLVTGSGWVLDGTEKSMIPTAAGLVFNNQSSPLQLYEWKNRIYLQAKLVSDLTFDLLKPTASTFDFTPSLTIKFSDLFDLTFSSNSVNEVIARYYQNWMHLPVTLPGERNAITDLLNSFDFADDNVRRLSGFKLKSLSFDLTHYLHDWTANLKTTIKPKLKTDTTYHYVFEPTITFTVSWKPISDIKTTVKSKEGTFSLNTTNDDDDDDDDDDE